MQDLNQYYTEKAVSKRITELLDFTRTPNCCLELCAGMGGLVEPIFKKWPSIKLVTCDIDKKNHKYLENNYPFGKHHLIDVTSKNFEDLTRPLNKRIDLAVCNPPFCWQENTPYYRYLLSNFLGENYQTDKRVRTEIIFTIQNLRLLRKNSKLAIILPELIIKGTKFKKFRKFLAENYSIETLLEIKPNSFRRTEAQTYALIINNKTSKERSFQKISAEDEISISPLETFIEGSEPKKKTENLPFKIFRGRWTGRDCHNSDLPTFHTTTFKYHKSGYVSFEDAKSLFLHPKLEEKSKSRIADVGDIVIARVGSRSIGQVALIEKGQCIVSDCIMVVRFNLISEAKIFYEKNRNQLRSDLIKYSKGTCAKYLTQTDIEYIVWTLLSSQSEFSAIRLANKVTKQT